MNNDSAPSPPNGQPAGLDLPEPRFKVGDLVGLRSAPDLLLPIIDVLPSGMECRYTLFQENRKAVYYESQLLRPTATDAQPRSMSVERLHAYLTSLMLLSPSSAHLFSFRSGRVQFVPYQYRPVLKFVRADRPRLLIADEVGVGKTIEAGLIIKELRARADISSVLVICPKALVSERKWLVEMKRFDEHFTALDGPMLRHCLRETHLDGEWPDQYAKAIVPFSLFDSDLLFGRSRNGRKRDQGLITLDPPPRFDLVIVDEAHHIRNTETYLHHGVRYFCDNAQAVLFLTATPVQLGSDDLFTMLHVLRSDLVIDRPSFEQMAAPNRHINMAVRSCRAAKEGWQEEARSYLDEAARTHWGGLFLRNSPAFRTICDRLSDESADDADRVGLTHAIEDISTFSPLINRTRRRDIGEFTTRKPETLTADFTPEQRALHDRLLEVVASILACCHGEQNVKFMMTTLRRQAASCIFALAPLLRDMLTGKLDRLEAMEATDSDLDVAPGFLNEIRSDVEDVLKRAESLVPPDPKVDAFLRVLRTKSRMHNKKALVFSTFRHTLGYLARHVEHTGLRFGLVHGHVPDEDRAELRHRFALPSESPDAIDVMLSSEVGCEGLDFQFCDLLVNYDLPWNPMRIEQRIGRIDRYGQHSETIAIVNLITPGTVDAEIYQRCLLRIGVFEHAVGGCEDILGRITQEIHDIADNFALTPELRAERLQQVADNSIRRVQEEEALEAKQAELFGLAVPKAKWQEEIEAAESFWLSEAAMERCVATYLAERLEADRSLLLGEKPLKTLRLSQEARTRLLDDYKALPRAIDSVSRQWEKWLKGTQPTLPVTFEQETAAANPQTVHLNVLHPLVRQAARRLEEPELAWACLAVRAGVIPSGEYDFAIYRWRKQGLKPDESLVVVSTESRLEGDLMLLLPMAVTSSATAIPDAARFDALDGRHHDKWTEAREKHIIQNRQLVAHRVESLGVSHRARCKVLDDQIAAATNDRIRLMKQRERDNAQLDFERRRRELQRAADTADIHAMPVVWGVVIVNEREAR